MLDRRTVSNAYVRTILTTAESMGVTAQQMLRGLPLDEAQLAEPTGRIGADLERRIWARAVDLTGDPGFGLKFALDIKPNTFRMLGLAVMHSASLRQALQLVLRYYRLVSEAGRFTIDTAADGSVTVAFEDELTPGGLLPQQMEAVMGGIVAQARWLSGENLPPAAVTFSHAPLAPLATYEEFFGLTPMFGAARNSVSIAPRALDRRLPLADEQLCRLHCDLADRELANLPVIGSVTRFAVQWLGARPSGAVRVSDLAAAMGTSVRSLQRQLAAEDTSWTSVVDLARRESFATLMRDGLTLDEAAVRLGYHDASSLSRAARRWFGTTPGQWRAGEKADLAGTRDSTRPL